MQLMVPLLAAALLATPASACGLALNTGGVLALSANGKIFGSGEVGGVPATFTVVNGLLDGPFTVTVEAPVLGAPPAGFQSGSAQVEVAYSGAGLLGSVSQGYISSRTSFNGPGLLSLAVVMTIHNRIRNDAGFASGTYTTKTVVTCS